MKLCVALKSRLCHISPYAPQQDWDDVQLPELTKKDFADIRPARDVLPALIGEEAAAELLRKRGRPKTGQPKKAVSLRLDPDVIAFFKAVGPGWQSRTDAALKEWMKEHKAA